jgi:hypothetical protein
VDVYLLPHPVGRGVGDIEEVLLAGRRLHRAGFPIHMLTFPRTPVPAWWDGPWDWPPLRRTARPRPTSTRALTLCTNWGVTAAPEQPGPLGHAGPWAPAVEAIERAYGTDHVVHISFEEFGRTFSSRRQECERFREGGMPVRAIQRHLCSPAGRREIRAAHDAYARYRGFAHPNVLHLYPSFQPAPGFRREFPSALVCGPFRPDYAVGTAGPSRTARRPPVWFWYASPGSSARLASALDHAVQSLGARLVVEYRGDPCAPEHSSGAVEWRRLPLLPPSELRERFRRAELRIVTGSRTLIEALALGGPFLYFNGVLGAGAHQRRHRAEKVDALRALWQSQGVPDRTVQDLVSFSGLRGVRGTVGRALGDRQWTASFRRRAFSRGFPPPWGDAGALLDAVVKGWSSGAHSAPDWVGRVRSGQLTV